MKKLIFFSEIILIFLLFKSKEIRQDLKGLELFVNKIFLYF